MIFKMKIKSMLIIIILLCVFAGIYGFIQLAKIRVNDQVPFSFNILINYDGQVKIELSDLLREGKFLDKHLYFNIEDYDCAKNYIDNTKMLIEYDFPSSGTYTFKIYKEGLKDELLWKQDVYVIRQSDYASDATSSEEKRRKLAADYAPVLNYFQDSEGNTEKYYPISLDWLFQNDKPILLHDFKSISGKRYVVDNLAYLDGFLRYNGGSANYGDALIDFIPGSTTLKDITGSPELATVYYSILEDSRRIYLNYHFFYAFDTKINKNDAQKPAIGSHDLDRESMTVVFDKNGETVSPAFLALGHHAKGQSFSLYDEHDQQVQQWYGDGVRVKWQEAYKYSTHPVVSIARGSHAVYPVVGKYNDYVPNLGALGNYQEYAGLVTDIACSVRNLKTLFIPKSLQLEIYEHNNTYELLSLNIDKADSNNVFSYSGYWVDSLTNFKFPPFTDRERDVSGWVDSLWWFDMKNIPEYWKPYNEQLLKYLEYKP